MQLKLTINDIEISNSNILDKIEFITDLGTQDFTVGKLIVPTAKIKLHESIDIKIGDIIKIYLDDAIYGTYEPYEIKQGQMSRDVTLYAMPYFALTKTFQPSKTEYTTRSLLLEMQTAIGFNIVDFEDIVAIDMKGVTADTGVNLLQAIAMILGVNCFITEYGEILFKLIGNNTARYTVTTRNGEYIQTLANEDLIVVDTDIHNVAQSQITKITKMDTTDYHITRIIGKLNDSDENPIIVGTQANAWNDLTLINPYLTTTICNNILATLPSYTGFELTIFNAPIFRPLDKIVFTYKDVEYTIPIMNLTLTFSVGGLVAKVQACVSNAQDKAGNYKGSLTTKLEVVKNVQSELNTKVEVVDGRVSSLITKTDAIEGEQTTIKNQYSQINQTIGEIDLRVGQVQTELGDKVSTDEIITSINLSNEGVKIQGDKVVLTGDTIIIGANGEQTITQFIKDEGENLLLKPNFNDGTLSDWGYSVSSYIFVDTTYKHNDNTACKLQYTGTSSAIMLSTTSMSIDKFESGKTYKVGVWIYVEDKTKLTNTMYLRANGMTSGATSRVVIAERTITSANLVNNEWTQLSFEFTPTQDYTSPQLIINVTGGVSAWVTDFSLQEQGGLSQTEIVKILNGAGDGLYLVDGELLINAEYIQTGTVRADLIKVNVDGATKNLLPFNYVTMDSAINTKFYINEDDNGYPYAECDLPIYGGGGSSDFMCVPFGYSNVTIESGKSYWFTCEYYAQWNNDTKPVDGVGMSTIGSSKYGTKTGNNLDIFLYNSDDISKLNNGRNLLDNTDGRLYATLWSHPNLYQASGFTVSYSQETSYGLGYTMLTGSGDSTEEYYYRFVFPNPYDLQGLEAGCTYTLSGKVCGTMPTISIRHEWSKGEGWLDNTYYDIPLKGEDNWIPFSYTFTIPSDATGFHLGFQSKDQIVKTICYLAHLKLEKSSKATSWCLSPADKGEEIPTYVEESTPLFKLASVKDFNAHINIVERENYEGVYQRGWTRLVGRIDATESYTGRLWINIDGSGFDAGDDGWFYLSKLQLVDAEESNENIELDYIQQVREKHIELTDGSYYTGTYSVDGIQLVEGTIQATSDTSKREFEIDYEGFNFRSTTGSENCFLGLGKAQYSYDAGSSGTIYGYDDLYGVGCRYLIEDTGDYEGIFCGVHKGFQIPNSTSYGRADIYVRNRYSDRLDFDDWTDWSLLGAKVEPNALVRRNDNCSIATNGLVIQGDATNTDFSQGGTTYHGSVMFSEPLYTTTGNGQIINVHKDNQRIYFGNPNSQVLIESGNVLQAKYNNVTYNLGSLLASSASTVSLDDDGEDVQQPLIMQIVSQLQTENEELKAKNQELEERLVKLEALLLKE